MMSVYQPEWRAQP